MVTVLAILELHKEVPIIVSFYPLILDVALSERVPPQEYLRTVPIKCIFLIQVVPGQAGGGCFKFETLIAYRAEQWLCL